MKELLATQTINVNAKDDEGRTLLALSMANVNSDTLELVGNLLDDKYATDVNTIDAKG